MGDEPVRSLHPGDFDFSDIIVGTGHREFVPYFADPAGCLGGGRGSVDRTN